MEGQAPAGDLGCRDADEYAIGQRDPGSQVEPFDTVNLCWIGDHLSTPDNQDAPPRLQGQLHIINFESDLRGRRRACHLHCY